MSEKHHDISELNQLFSDGESQDTELFAEQRSNVQLVAGEHYAKKGNRFWNRLRDHKNLDNDQKIRLTKNHIRKITLIYRNAITSYSPGVQASAKDKSSIQHQKAAELVNSVWADGKARHDFNQQINNWAADFTNIGEVAVKIFFDPMAGKFLGMEQQMDEMGQLSVDEMGQPVAGDNPKFAGDVLIERVFGFNLVRAAGSKNMLDSPFLCIKKMAKISELKQLIDSSETLDDSQKTKIKAKLNETVDQTFIVLDGTTANYRQVKGQTMLKEFFFRPCAQYPMGYFYICTPDDVIFEGELPFGIFPIKFKGFDEIQTSPRCRSIVKQLRPNQVEINRCASTIAEHQITLGWDKILVQNGTKISPGTAFPGVRSFQYSGMTPIIMEGKTGNQYLEYMQTQIAEMYSIAMVDEVTQEKDANFDVYAMLARSIKDKKKFSVYTDSFESFLRDVFKTYVDLCQKYYTDQHLIPAVGKSEYINISEFKGVDDLCYAITPESQCDDSESKLGRQLMLNHIIQYVGPQLGKDDIGKIIRLMPYANDELILEDLTMDYDAATNYILQLDRGQVPTANPYDNHIYLIKKLTSRTRKPDYQFLPENVKQLYREAIELHEMLKTDEEMKIKQAQSEFIPSGGYLVACDFYVPDPKDPSKLPKRIRIPSEALTWLLKQLDVQGSDQASLSGVNQGALSEMSQMLTQKTQAQGGGMGPQPQQAQLMGQTSPGGLTNGY